MPLIGPSATLRRCGPCGRIALLLLSGLIIAALDGGDTSAQPVPAGRHEVRNPIAAHIAEAARRFGIPERWIVAVMRAESAGNTRAISHAGAQGLMQVMPATWDDLRVRHRLGSDPFDPRDNILAGAAYLREMYDRYGTIPPMLAAYNAGPDRYDEYLATGRPLPAETRAYVDLLAPALDATVPSQGAPATPSPPPDWREAPLFVPRSTDPRMAATRTTGKRSDRRSTSVPVRPDAEDHSHPKSIFIAQDDTGADP
ncbi:transglycosylase-like protein with SLT domain [Breoghania corrubedonensis]|uniref:Transglycosylase-like protein with SLT domain n=1 Tax=Breoghania corrubedonensis TaxID=665038 RepID=A0A2T5VHB4_9HYPH|nr:lytic transglycosylase domain-containing protein [Breoghania corrubedonensis]PTW63149.1 transglycosylase-like protein with SLT domain [Breoghania corrubedonensis]